ncbi:hypothetical protein V1512DRAFT_262142 [Lipomyces arxii]|uniref:uncharacterized protein n=1 Tax=Lipomyces arxii TaxID=56418 RepID=UPI0034CE347B
MSIFTADDTEIERMRKLIAADYSESESEDSVDHELDNIDELDDDNDSTDAILKRFGKAAAKLRTINEDDEDEIFSDVDLLDFADESALLDPSLRPARQQIEIRSKRKKKRNGNVPPRTREAEPSEEVKILLGQANQAYATDDLDEAERFLAEVIRIDNHVYAAWKTLGEIHKQRGDIPKCLLAWISAGHLRLKDSELWSICGKLSVQIGQIDQALYCYNRAILANSRDVESIYERGMVFKQMGNNSKALEAFRKLHELLPHDLTVIRELASAYVMLNNVTYASKLYEEILQIAKSPDLAGPDDEKSPPFGWSELNILAELYGVQKDWLRAIELIKSTARWLLQRDNEKFWNDVAEDNDDEYFPDRAVLNKHFSASKRGDAEAMAEYTLPLDLRAKMAVFRLKLGHVDTALKHTTFVLNVAEQAGENCDNPSQYADLFMDVAEALADAEQYEPALALYAPLAETEEYSTPRLVMAMGRCLHGLDDFDQAESAYQTVVASDATNLDARIALAEVYEATGRRQEALELVNEVMRLRRDQERQKNAVPGLTSPAVADSRAASEPADEPENSVPSFIPNTDGRQSGRGTATGSRTRGTGGRPKITLTERMQAEERACELVQTKLRRLRQYEDGLNTGNPVAVSEWLQTASELVDMFTNTKVFFPVDKQRVFRGFFVTAKRRAGKQTMNDKLKGMATRLQESLQQPELTEQDPEENATEFRGLGFDGWFTIFMQYALTLTWHEEVEDAYSVLRRARDANVFHQDKERVRIMTLVQLSCALHVQDYKTAMETVRVVITQQDTQFAPDMYRLLLCSVPSGPAAIKIFNLPSTQKYLLRHVKGMDSILEGKAIVGSIKVKHGDNGESSSNEMTGNPILLTLYGQILAASRSHVPSLSYYMRAFEIAPTDPMILFSIALAHLHRAMQRQTNNRHLQVVQGLSYLVDYCRARSKLYKDLPTCWVEEQETNYNMGRAFHMLGLPSLAVQYYERGLAVVVPDDARSAELENMYGLRREIAYNLQLMYMMSGNAKLARMIVDKYLVM